MLLLRPLRPQQLRLPLEASHLASGSALAAAHLPSLAMLLVQRRRLRGLQGPPLQLQLRQLLQESRGRPLASLALLRLRLHLQGQQLPLRFRLPGRALLLQPLLPLLRHSA